MRVQSLQRTRLAWVLLAKSTQMPMRYGEEVLAARGGMARAAQAQGRDRGKE